MLQMTQLSNKIILNQKILHDLRIRFESVSTLERQQNDVIVELEGILNDHLRGLDFQVKRMVRNLIITTCFKADEAINVNYYDVARLLINLELPIKQILYNFQNWIIMSTEFNLTFEEIVQVCLSEDLNCSEQRQKQLEDNQPSPMESEQVLSLPVIELVQELEENLELHLESLSDQMHKKFVESMHVKESEFVPESEPVTKPILELEPIPEIIIEYETEIESNTYIIQEPLLEEDQFVSLLGVEKSDFKPYRIRYKILGFYVVSVLALTCLIFIVTAKMNHLGPIGFAEASSIVTIETIAPENMRLIVKSIFEEQAAGFPRYFEFEPVNKERLMGYLKRKNSLLADEPYFSTILNTCASENIHPALLFAIVGQEQGFVKRGSENAALIVNNPFNVFHSWAEYNTTIKDSSLLAAETVREALHDRPKNENAFKWLNKTYAEDPLWWKGTESIFKSIEDYLGPFRLEVQ